jgi:phosphate transport system substrate-binding protein
MRILRARTGPLKTLSLGLGALMLALAACTSGSTTTTTPAAGQPTTAAAAASPASGAAAAATRPAGTSAAAAAPFPTAGNLASLSGTVRVDGSSTVFPITEAMAEEFQKATGGRTRVTVGISGTGGGFQKFCNDETDISDASRPIRKAEIDACAAKNIKSVEIPVAYDGLSVVVSPRNTFLTCIKVSELKKMWEPPAQGTVTRWSQIRAEWPDRPFRLFGAGSDSGTFEYFTEAINGRAGASRGDYTASEDDNVLVQGVSNDADAIGYFGYAYYAENQNRLKLVQIDQEKGAGCVAPSEQTINAGTYQPLSRPLFIYAKESAMARPEVKEFVRFYLDPKNNKLISSTGYVALPERLYPMAWQRFDGKKFGTVFGGQTTEGIKVDDLFKADPT